jgi:hypothetical protein
MAPEMRMDADSALPGPTDVYSLAKTIWVLITGMNILRPGQHRAHDEAYSIACRIRHARAGDLDRLIELATDLGPENRPSMTEMANELSACAEPPRGVAPPPDVSDIERRITAHMDPVYRRQAEQQNRGAEISNSWRDFNSELDRIWGGWRGSLRLNGQKPGDCWEMSKSLGAIVDDFANFGFGLQSSPPSGCPTVQVHCSLSVRVPAADGIAQLAGVVSVRQLDRRGIYKGHDVWQYASSGIRLPSAKWKSCATGIVDELERRVYRDVAECVLHIIDSYGIGWD